ncbi:MAG: serine hydrolase [Oceanibaculum sp.]
MRGLFPQGRNGEQASGIGRLVLLPLLFVMALAVTVAAPRNAEAQDTRYAALVIDYSTGKVLFERHADARRYPASLTKMMTLYMTFEALESGKLKLDQRLTVSQRAAGMPPSKLGIPAGKTITVRDAIYALITRSANDIAVVLAESLGGTEIRFAQLMTERARRLGMTNTSFRNASGLPNNGQVSTARDMAQLAVRLMRDYPQYYDMFKVRSFTHGGSTFVNHNRLLGNLEGTDGIKTGYIRASGFNLVASAKRGQHRLIGVVFGGQSAASRDAHMMELLEAGFTDIAQIRTASTVPLPARKPVLEDAPGAQPVAVAEAGATRLADEDALAQGDAPGTAAARDLWGVQVGAFAQEGAARDALSSARKLAPTFLKSAQLFIERARPDQKPLYRARLLGMTEKEARQACAALKSKKMACVPVPPDAIVSVASLPN